MAKKGARLIKVWQRVERGRFYALDQAVQLIRECATAKFDETIDIALHLNIDSRKSDQGVRGVVQLPGGTGKVVRVAVFARDEKAKAALAAGADVVGAEDLASDVQEGNLNFDRCIATPDLMGLVGRLGKILGPRGLMPNPKLGTVTMDVTQAVEAAKGGQIEYRAEKAGIVHGGMGKASFSPEALLGNIQAFISSVLKAKPPGVKGVYVKRMSLSSTMGPSVALDLSDALKRA